MSAQIHDFDPTRCSMANARKISIDLIKAAEASHPDTETAIAGFVQAAHDVALASQIPDIARRTAALLRGIASMIEQTQDARSAALL